MIAVLKKYSLVYLFVCLLVFIPISEATFSTKSVSAHHMLMPHSFYDQVAKNWTLFERGSSRQNCFAYVFSYPTWVWPWGTSNPTFAEMNSVLVGELGLTRLPNSHSNPGIIVYGTISNIPHMGRGDLGNGRARSKWGNLEIITNNSLDPYHSIPQGGYGSRYASFTRY